MGDEGEDEPEGKEEASKPESPVKKVIKKTEKPEKTKASPKARGKAKAKDNNSAPAASAVDPAVLKQAKDLGFESALLNLSNRDELKGKSAAAMLKALQS